MNKKQFKYTGKANSLDNHLSDYYESKYWNICVWDGDIVFNSKKFLQGELESNSRHFYFSLEDGIMTVCPLLTNDHEGWKTRYIEGYRKLPIPKYVYDFIKSLEEKYVNSM